jgi:hypothetical protein
MTTTLLVSPRSKVAACAIVLRRAQLPAEVGYDRHVGHHVRVNVAGSNPGYYLVTPARVEQFRVRWYPRNSQPPRPDLLGIVDTPARAAGLILDHYEGLVR